MFIDKFGANWKKVVNFVMILSIIVALIVCGFLCASFGIIGAMVGIILGFVGTYLLEIILFTPGLIIFNILINLDILLTKKNKKEE